MSRKYLVFDLEADGFLDTVSKIHCIVTSDLGGNVRKFIRPTEDKNEGSAFIKLIQEAKQDGVVLAGHNILGYDLRVLEHFFPEFSYPEHLILDTLVVSRLFNYGMKGGHSIEAWGERLGVKKEGTDITDWSVLTDKMLTRCVSDVAVNVSMIKNRFLRYLDDANWDRSIAVEHDVARMCLEMTANGLPFDLDRANDMHSRLAPMLAELDKELQTAFPPDPVFVRTVQPRATKSGALSLQDFRWMQNWEYSYDDTNHRVVWLRRRDEPSGTLDLSAFDGSSFDIYEMVPFNPGSPKQIVDRLNRAGWKPTEKTKGHQEALRDRKTWKDKKEYYTEFGWKVSEENLKTLPETAPAAAKKLAQRLIVASRLSDLEEWIVLARPEDNEYRIHGNYMPIGAWTHRLSHMNPNTANIPVAKRSPKDTEFEVFVNDINDEMRALFIAGHRYMGRDLAKMRQVGTDADGIQMRIFAHLVGDQRLIDSLVKGSKENGTDIHTLHKGFLGDVCKSRDAAKTFIYAFLLGAGVGKIAEILECSTGLAKIAVSNFLEAYPGLKELKETQIPRDAERGYFIGLDGRKVMCDSEHLMLSGYLQNGEKVIMARAGVQWKKELDGLQIPYWLINWVHDEWQTLIPDDNDICSLVQRTQIQAIRDQADALDMLCPLEGSSDWGYDWHSTH